MKDVWIRISSVQQVQRFVSDLVPLKGDFEFIADHLILDARSLMGIFGLDLTRPLRLRVYDDSPANLVALAPYLDHTEVENHEQ
jgi:phosphocarrier protein HPr